MHCKAQTAAIARLWRGFATPQGAQSGVRRAARDLFSVAVARFKRLCALAHIAVAAPAVTITGCITPQPESPQMSNAIAAHKHRTMLHVLRDRVQRAQRDEKRGMAGAAERVAAHTAKRAAYRAANP